MEFIFATLFKKVSHKVAGVFLQKKKKCVNEFVNKMAMFFIISYFMRIFENQ